MSNRALGLDVSRWQPVIDWAKVKAAGATYVFVKATQGTTGVDDKFAAHWAGAKAVGMWRGAYHFYQPTVNAVEQAKKFMSRLGNDPGELPPVLDVEIAGVGPAALRDGCLAWLNEVEQQMGRRPIVYTRASFWNIYLRDIKTTRYPDWTANYPLWTAHYNTTVEQPMLPKGWNAWTFWQFTESGAIDGYKGKTDQNWYNGTVEDLQAWVEAGPAQPLAPVPDVPVSFSVEDEVIPDLTNQDVINAFLSTFGNDFSTVLERANLQSLTRDRESPYYGPSVDDMDGLTYEERDKLKDVIKWA